MPRDLTEVAVRAESSFACHFVSARKRLRVGLAVVVGLGMGATLACPASASSAPAPGRWTVLGAALGQPEGGTPTVWEDASRNAYVMWLRKPTSSTATYEVAEIAANGSIAKAPADIFAGQDWANLSGEPTLVADGAVPQVVFSGIQSATGPYSSGCVYGAAGGTSPWTVQTWSLSNNCVNPIGGAAESKAGVLASAFPGGWATGHGVIYHIGVSGATPATEPDGQIGLSSGDAYKAAVVNDTAGSGDFTVVWAREFSNPGSGDGYYVQDVTAGKPAVKAPGTGTNSLNHLSPFANIAVSASNSHAGLYLAYCSNANTCKLQLWHVGAAKALTVPGSSAASDVAISAGPGGRVWIAWSNSATNAISVVRTNTAVTKFGPVKTYPTACFEHGLIGLSSGAAGRLDLAVQCINNAKLQLQDMVTQTLVPVQVALSKASVSNAAKRTLTVSVTDVGNPVKGAKVVLAGHKATTNAKGKATVTLAKGAKVGSYTVVVTDTNYLNGSAKLTVSN
jgi:hypothetical protein